MDKIKEGKIIGKKIPGQYRKANLKTFLEFRTA